MYKLMIHVIIFANQTNNKVIYEKVNYGSSGCRSCFWLRSTIIFSKQRHNDYATASYDTSFFVSGIGQSKQIDAAQVCGGADKVVRTEVQQTFVNGLLGFVTFGIYTPREARVYCAK